MPKQPETWLPSAASRPSVGTLIYFEFRARGEPPHMVAAYLGLHLQNARLPFSEYGWMKRSLPCPALQLPDGALLGETQDICRYLAKLPSPVAGRPPLIVDSTQERIFEISNTPPVSHSQTNPLNIWWLLNMYRREEGLAQLPSYLAAIQPTFRRLEARLASAGGSGPSSPAPSPASATLGCGPWSTASG